MIVLVPSTLALLPAYAGLEDPVDVLRSACRSAVAALVSRHPDRVAVVAVDPRADNLARGVRQSAGSRIAVHLLGEAGFRGEVVSSEEDVAAGTGVLVVGNGSAMRDEKAPGHLDERAFAFDEAVDGALRSADGAALSALDPALAEELWCYDARALQLLGRLLESRGVAEVEVAYDGDPFGVRYWVVTWSDA